MFEDPKIRRAISGSRCLEDVPSDAPMFSKRRLKIRPQLHDFGRMPRTKRSFLKPSLTRTRSA
eukprot:8863004-Pyramimonas_sp.AAC.1